MAIEIKRRKGESFEAMMRRFHRRLQLSGTILQAKKVRFLRKDENKNRKKDSALRRLEIKAKREYLIKTGQLVEEMERGRGRR